MSNFTVVRSTTIAAPPAAVHALVDDFHAWRGWSPWESLDANLARSYTGAETGVGANYAWVGKKAGAGSMEITESTPDAIAITLRFLKPWKATNQVVFAFAPAPEGTAVSWTMTGEHRGVGRLFALFMSMDKMVGKDFEKGLAGLKALAEKSGDRP